MPATIIEPYGSKPKNNDGYKVGDVIAIQGTVVEVMAEQVRVELFSKTDQYTQWVRNAAIHSKLIDAEDADEPEELGSLAEVTLTGGAQLIYRRVVRADDNHPAHWYRVGSFLADSSEFPDTAYVTWRELKSQGEWKRLWRDGEV